MPYEDMLELYAIREQYNAALFNEWAKQGQYHVHKSRRHHSGDWCVEGHCFIVVAILPTGQISNHYPIAAWDLFKIPDYPKALFPYDGHETKDTIERLRRFNLG